MENRVRILKKEEDRMIKKINEARTAAEKMAATKEYQNDRFMAMMEFRMG